MSAAPASKSASSPTKRILNDQTSQHNNRLGNEANKKRKLEVPANGKPLGSQRGKLSQVKSSFEEDLGRLTQEINGLKGGRVALFELAMGTRG